MTKFFGEHATHVSTSVLGTIEDTEDGFDSQGACHRRGIKIEPVREQYKK